MKLLHNEPFYSLIRYSTKSAVKLLINMDCHNPATSIKGPKIFAANHPSTLDPLMVMSALDDKVSALLTGDAFEIPIIGSLLTRAGHIPVFKGQGREAYQMALAKLQHGKSILIFPEGSLSESDGNTKPLYSGAVRLAQETKAPIIPVGISFALDKTLNKKMHLNGKIEQARFMTHGTYAVTFGDPLYVVGDKQHIRIFKQALLNKLKKLAQKSELRLQQTPTHRPLLGRVVGALS